MKDSEKPRYLEHLEWKNKNIDRKTSEVLHEIANLQDTLLILKKAKVEVVKEWAALNPPANFIGGEAKEDG
jgi:hypothetical protein